MPRLSVFIANLALLDGVIVVQLMSSMLDVALRTFAPSFVPILSLTEYIGVYRWFVVSVTSFRVDIFDTLSASSETPDRCYFHVMNSWVLSVATFLAASLASR